ncbi:MFS transporter, partial [cyanobacterium TDX16]
MADAAPGQIRLGTAAGRWLLVGTILGTAVVFIDSTVVNVALPAIQEDLGGGVSGLQWTIDSYLLALSALILVGGSLADLYGRRR